MVASGGELNTRAVSFLTPYWSGREMMRIHLASIRRFHPAAPILVSKRGDDDGEMESLRREFGIRYRIEECGYTNAYLRLLARCETRFACVLDHDTVLLSSLDPFLRGLDEGSYDLVGFEERIRLPDGSGTTPWPASDGWLRFAPGCTASNFLLFDWQAFKACWGMRGVQGKRLPGARHFEFYYGIGQRLARPRHLSPYHARKYGVGNLLKDGDSPVVWHQWYGSYRTRLAPALDVANEDRAAYAIAEAGERAFIADYPTLDFDGLAPAWGPDRDVRAEQQRLARSTLSDGRGSSQRVLQRLRRWKSYGMRGFAAHALAGLERWWRLR